MKQAVRDIIVSEIESLDVRISMDQSQLKSLRESVERLTARVAKMRATRDELKAELPELGGEAGAA